MKVSRQVLFCLPSISRAGGGVAESARLQALALASGPDIDVSVMAFNDEHFNLDIGGWQNIRVRSFRTYGPKSYSFSPCLLLALLRERPDVVHVHGVWQFHCLAVYIWSLLTGGIYVVTPHGMLETWIRARSPRLKALVSSLYQNRFLRRAAAFQVLTDREVNDVADFAHGQPVEIIPNYVAPFSRDNTPPIWWRREYEGKDVYLFLGRIHEKKGCLELCQAWGDICGRRSVFRDRSLLVYCGWNDGLTGFEDAVSALNAQFGNAVFAGPQYGAEKQRSLSRATFFVLPSKSEGLPMSILEAWSARIPVVMTEECNLPIGFDRKAAIRTGSDRQSIGSSLEDACALTEGDRKTLAENGYLLLQERFSQGGVREALVRLYDQARQTS
ncbi:glycosyltransferase involved in cell wall biosynthesis [Rhizobium aquaticum]|uniref:Glycosyltransferase involved in cell wall biosynthesis n=1 Tax=Rhizobium aquaticum TaxID=1549636 RepID=A0ABV2J2U2_9HYPH